MWLYVQTCDQKLVHKFRCSQAIRKIVVHCSTSWEQQEDLQYNHAYEAADFGKWYVLLLSFYSFLAMNLTFCRYGSTLLYFTSFLVHSLHSFCVNRGERSEITKNGVIACRPGMTEWPQRIKKARTNESIRILRRQKSPHYLDLFSISYQNPFKSRCSVRPTWRRRWCRMCQSCMLYAGASMCQRPTCEVLIGECEASIEAKKALNFGKPRASKTRHVSQARSPTINVPTLLLVTPWSRFESVCIFYCFLCLFDPLCSYFVVLLRGWESIVRPSLHLKP